MDAPAIHPQETSFPIVLGSPIGNESHMAMFPHGMTIADAMGDDAAYSAEVRIDGQIVPRGMWSKIKPRPGVPVHVLCYPQGGNAGKWVRLVALAVLTYFTAGVASGAYGSVLGVSSASGLAALGVGMMMVGQLAITPMIGQAYEVAA